MKIKNIRNGYATLQYKDGVRKEIEKILPGQEVNLPLLKSLDQVVNDFLFRNEHLVVIEEKVPQKPKKEAKKESEVDGKITSQKDTKKSSKKSDDNKIEDKESKDEEKETGQIKKAKKQTKEYISKSSENKDKK